MFLPLSGTLRASFLAIGRLNEKQDRNAMVSAILPHLRQVNGHPRAVALFKKVVLATYQFSSQDFDRQIVTRFLTYEGAISDLVFFSRIVQLSIEF